MNLPSAAAHTAAGFIDLDLALTARSRTAPPPSPPAATMPQQWLWQQDFLHELQREVRRAERTGAPLSLAVYRFNAAKPDAALAAAELQQRLQAGARGTDFVGQPDALTLAVLCPDTDAAGLQAFMRKQAVPLDGSVQTSSATYPDDLFASLAASTRPTESLAPFLGTSPGAAPAAGYPLKRTLDVLGAGLALVLFSPLMAAVAVAIAATSRGPVIFRQARLGRGGVPFTFYKFRSMRTDADDGIHRQYVARLITAGEPAAADGQAAGAAPYKLVQDPRITRIGHFIRRTSIDELPQLFNVLKGDMSLVGPRPPLAYEAADYRTWHLRRIHDQLPGITGLWQVEGRSKVPFNDMVRMDLRYGRECSLGLDLRILLKTVAVVLGCRGAV